jgi:hypothetical protein
VDGTAGRSAVLAGLLSVPGVLPTTVADNDTRAVAAFFAEHATGILGVAILGISLRARWFRFSR